MIRQAKKEDVEQIIPLILIILKDMELEFLAKHGIKKVSDVLRAGYVTETFRYSYQRAIVDVEEEQILGVAFGYKDSEEDLIDQPLVDILPSFEIPADEKMFTDNEAFADEWYLDSIAVRADQRGQGVGARLLKALPDFAKEQGASKLGLSVDDGNPRAKQLYLRQGFEDVGRTVISGHDYDHMQRSV